MATYLKNLILLNKRRIGLNGHLSTKAHTQICREFYMHLHVIKFYSGVKKPLKYGKYHRIPN